MSEFVLSFGGAVHVAGGPSLLSGKGPGFAPPLGINGPDDICQLRNQGLDGGKILVWSAYQNGIQPNGTAGKPGGPTQSTVIGYDPSTGAPVQTVSVTGKIDGLGCDPGTGKLIATVNEDSNSAINLIDPATGIVTAYTYSPNPAVSGNGGTDSVAVENGHIYVSHSNPNDASQPTDYDVTFDDSTHTANLTPVFFDNSTATSVNTGSQVTLALTDPDTNFIMPEQSPKFAGDLATIAQADGQLIFASPEGSGAPNLWVLNLTDNKPGVVPPFDGLAVATSDSGTLYVVDAKGNEVLALDTAGWAAGTVFTGEPSDVGNPMVGTLDLSTGKVTPLANVFASPKGLLFVPDVPPSSTQAASMASTATATQTSTPNSGPDGILYGAIAVAVVIVVALAYVASRKRK